MAVLFNSVSQFVEQVGRRRTHKSKGTDLDTMSCIFTGPTVLVSGSIPADQTPHSDYPFMTSTGWDVKNIDAGVSELTVDYVGKFQGGPVLTNTQWHEGSISWSSYAGTVVRTYTPGFYSAGTGAGSGEVINIPPTTSRAYLTLSYQCRYVVSTIVSSYLSRGGSGVVSQGIGTPAVTNRVTYITGASTSNDKFGSVTATLNFLSSVNEQVTDLGNGWFLVEVTTTLLPVIESSANINPTLVPFTETTKPAVVIPSGVGHP